MKSVKVLIPFHNKDTKVDQVPGDVINVSEERLEEIRAINVNMVLVLGDVEEVPTEELKEEPVEEPIEEVLEEEPTETPTEEPIEELKEEPKEEVKKPKAKKTKTTK